MYKDYIILVTDPLLVSATHQSKTERFTSHIALF